MRLREAARLAARRLIGVGCDRQGVRGVSLLAARMQAGLADPRPVMLDTSRSTDRMHGTKARVEPIESDESDEPIARADGANEDGARVTTSN
ncbi:MAG: hypothetical protein ACTHN9_20825 [Trinickia sp.]